MVFQQRTGDMGMNGNKAELQKSGETTGEGFCLIAF